MLHVVVAYDVVEDRRRARLARALRGFLDRVQKSVFEGQIDERRLEPLRKVLAKALDHQTDSARVYLLCGRCRVTIEIVGVGVYKDDPQADLMF